MLKVIEENLDKEELGSTLIADRMAMSSRQFYRKFKEISNTAPGDLIKSYRMVPLKRLLQIKVIRIKLQCSTLPKKRQNKDTSLKHRMAN